MQEHVPLQPVEKTLLVVSLHPTEEHRAADTRAAGPGEVCAGAGGHVLQEDAA